MKYFSTLLIFCLATLTLIAQKKNNKIVANTPPAVVAEPFNADLFKGLKWRNIGPFRGGRSVACSGVRQNQLTYYMGSTGGGLWKTEDAGISWKNISDGQFKTGSVGAIAVAESDPNVLFVGMGEHPVRGVMTSSGDGVYKSTDAGKTWKNVGLEKTKHIAAVRIHPQNPDIVYVAAQGAVHGPSEDRGIYKTTDGGKTWTKLLYVNENTGCADLSMDMTNPRILYAGFWEHRRLPWTVRSGGAGSALYKSIDGGDTWNKMTEGLPQKMGKVAVSVSRANPSRVYANIESEGDKGGIYRSDDAGKTWTQTNKTRVTVARAWYYIEIETDPTNQDVVYCINAPVLKSIDGGRNFAPLRVPHGDNHCIWINPTNGQNIINSNDGGANISFNGGQTWSTQQNQPTAQFYRVIADKKFPYWVYGGQQDNSSVMTASRNDQAGLGWKDWVEGPGGESAFIAFDPENPELVYGGSYQGNISVLDTKTGAQKDIMAIPNIGIGITPKNQKYRFNWNAPIVAQPQNPQVIYHGGNVVLKTTDGGLNWQEISPDLTRNDKNKQENGGGPYTNEGAGGEVYNTLAYLIASPHKAGVLWTGSDCGLVHVTQDDGKTWQNVTPPNLGETLINSIEVSPHDAATAYIVATNYKQNDFSPQVFVTKDFGKTWTKIVNGIGAEDFARVVREDPLRKNLLYCGAETGLYVSFNGGEQWNKLQLNLPVVPITDLAIRDNDLVAATEGRAFWILDDLGAIQQTAMSGVGVKVFQPKKTVRFDAPSAPEPIPNLGQNPATGVILSYVLPKDMDSSNVLLQIIDGSGKVLRTYLNQKDKEFQQYEGGPAPKLVLPSKKGINRMAWDMRREPLPGVSKVFVNGDYRGSLVMPGVYKVRLIADKDTSTTTAEIIPDPRLTATMADFQAQQDIMFKAEDAVREMHNSVNTMRKIKSQIESLSGIWKDQPEMKQLIEDGKGIIKKITTWEESVISTKQETFQDVINFENKLNAEMLDLRNRADTHDPRPTKGVKDRLGVLQKDWDSQRAIMKQLIDKDLSEFNANYKAKQTSVISLPN
jgi:photosystem II stability/assembly factor-like uncharacterized protein